MGAVWGRWEARVGLVTPREWGWGALLSPQPLTVPQGCASDWRHWGQGHRWAPSPHRRSQNRAKARGTGADRSKQRSTGESRPEGSRHRALALGGARVLSPPRGPLAPSPPVCPSPPQGGPGHAPAARGAAGGRGQVSSAGGGSGQSPGRG